MTLVFSKRNLRLVLFFVSVSLFVENRAAAQTPAVCYEIFVRSFADSNGDGIGDLNGITAKLDYLKDLGVNALWLTPVNPSSSYHKYDVTDYYGIDPEYGTLEDYKRLLAEAHKRGINVLLDLVVNHTSNQHPWFLEARKDKTNPYRSYYVWQTPGRIDSLGIATREASGGSWELTPWHFAHPGDDEKYYGLFTGTMPDLNYDNPLVRQEIYKIGRFWLTEVGVDGFRLDAAKHIYPEWEAAKSHAFWQEFRQEMQRAKPNVYLVGEVWAKADIVSPYFRGLPANFGIDAHLMLHEMLKTGHDKGLIQKLIADYAQYAKVNPGFIDATLLSNHDGTRIGTIVGNDPNKLRLAASLLMTLPGEPYLYYGEELGMLGDKPDENLREPFLWAAGPRDSTRTRWMAPRYNTDQTVRPLSLQQADPTSLYHHYKRLIALRQQQPALRHVTPVNLREAGIRQAGVLAFVRPHATGDLLVLHNLTGQPQTVQPTDFRQVVFQSEPMSKKGQGWALPPFSCLILKR